MSLSYHCDLLRVLFKIQLYYFCLLLRNSNILINIFYDKSKRTTEKILGIEIKYSEEIKREKRSFFSCFFLIFNI